MSVDDAFETFQRTVNVPPEAVTLAVKRRKFFHDALGGEDDVREVVPSGSLARGTHKDPINDVDVIVIFDEEHHPDWGVEGESAGEALSYTGKRINELLGATNGSFAKEVRRASPRNHAVKCFLDDPEDPEAFTVDVMPAFRRHGALLVPEKSSNRWVTTDPEYLISEVEARHKEWRKYAGTVRMLKWWAADQDIKIKSLVMEVLALDNLPLGPNRPAALKEFFNKAWNHVWLGYNVEDPAGHCGVIQRDLDLTAFSVRLEAARDLANKAFQAQARGETTLAHRFWKELFGDDFPPPPSGGGGGKPAVVPPVLPPRPVKDTPQG
ncbi:SMODS domain-containing nucleotidyltransferase [Nocardioides donggukensis]|uniref:Nucleotidyltransferase domain-containing protein n=1 Tax=Nocardioides donggukensis TaxID=2774019 RepID=A0A927K4L3_9ACTN|nr:nucleotidyltransferase domain-containing protein [Nocardioides donggukensis]MBD8870612.1 nucleotidyltransferase domain-containing protein [Nocardioides donggukensis]